MDTVILKPGRIVAQRCATETVVRPTSVLDFLPFFFHRVELDPAFTLGDLFRLLDTERLEFLAEILGEDIRPLIEEARGGSQPEEDEQVEYLRVHNLHEDGQLFRDFDGWGRWNDPTGRMGPIAIELSPLRSLLDLPLRYEPELVFYDDGGQVQFRTTTGITLLEFLKAVFFELTFFGSPPERDAFREELEKRATDLKTRSDSLEKTRDPPDGPKRGVLDPESE